MVETRLSSGFSPKILFPGKRAILGLKMARPHNFLSVLRIFLKFYIMKGAKRYMGIKLMVFLKKFSFGANGPF